MPETAPMLHERTLSPARRRLAGKPRHVRKALGMARRMGRKYRAIADELPGAALLGLADAARTFRHRQGTSFRTHLHRRVLGAMVDFCRHWTNYNRTSRSAPRIASMSGGMTAVRSTPGSESSVDIDLSRALASDDLPVGWEIESADAVEHLVRHLDRARRETILALYLRADCHHLNGRVASLLGVREATISLRKLTALEVLRTCHGGDPPPPSPTPPGSPPCPDR